MLSSADFTQLYFEYDALGKLLLILWLVRLVMLAVVGDNRDSADSSDGLAAALEEGRAAATQAETTEAEARSIDLVNK